MLFKVLRFLLLAFLLSSVLPTGDAKIQDLLHTEGVTRAAKGWLKDVINFCLAGSGSSDASLTKLDQSISNLKILATEQNAILKNDQVIRHQARFIKTHCPKEVLVRMKSVPISTHTGVEPWRRVLMALVISICLGCMLYYCTTLHRQETVGETQERLHEAQVQQRSTWFKNMASKCDMYGHDMAKLIDADIAAIQKSHDLDRVKGVKILNLKLMKHVIAHIRKPSENGRNNGLAPEHVYLDSFKRRQVDDTTAKHITNTEDIIGDLKRYYDYQDDEGVTQNPFIVLRKDGIWKPQYVIWWPNIKKYLLSDNYYPNPGEGYEELDAAIDGRRFDWSSGVQQYLSGGNSDFKDSKRPPDAWRLDKYLSHAKQRHRDIHLESDDKDSFEPDVYTKDMPNEHAALWNRVGQGAISAEDKKNQYRKFDAMMRFGAGRTNKGFNGGKHIETAVDKMNSDVTDFNFARNHEDGLSTMFKLGCIFVLLALLATLIAQTTRDYHRYDWVREAAKAQPQSKNSGIFGNMNQLSGILGQLGGLADANGADGAGGGNILNQLLGIMGGGDGDGEMPDLGGLMNQFAGGGEGKEGGENPFAGLIGQMADGLQKAGGEGGDQKGDNPLGGLGGMLDQFMGAAKNDGKEGGENGGGIGDMLNQFMGAAKNDGKDGGDVKDGNFNDLIGNFVKNLGGGEKKE
eukprot:215693_1